MTRSTDTRALVREAAEKLFRQGKTPTPTIVRELLGKGSPNTIVSELRAWSAEKAGDPPSSTAPALRAPAAPLENLEQLEQLVRRLEAAAKLPATPTEHVEQALRGVELRFEGVQKYMLLQVAEAREEASKWKGRFETLKDEFGQWQTVTRQRHSALVTENAWLRGRLNEDIKDNGPFFVDASTQKKIAEGYPGFPRARHTDDT